MSAAPLPAEALVTVPTARFGVLEVPAEHILRFPDGLPGFEREQAFVLLPVRAGLAWLQSAQRPELAFLLVTPSRAVEGAWADEPMAWAIVTLGRPGARATANLMAPVMIDWRRQHGHQEIRPDAPWSVAEPFDLPGD